MTTITFKSYRRRDGSTMLYINRSNGVSVGVSPELGFTAYGKGVTLGQRNAFSAALRVAADNGEVFTGDLAQHAETGFCAPVACGPFTLVGTDAGSVGGQAVGADGGYVVYRGRLLRQGVAYAEAMAEAE